MEMKELYTSPEVKLINFLAQENLTADDVEKEMEFTDSVAGVQGEDIAIELF